MTIANSMLARLLEDLPDLAVVLDATGNLLWGNRAASALFGRSLEESIGMSGLEFVHPDDLELVLRSLDSVQAKAVGTAIEIRLRTPTGWCLVELIGTPVPWFEEGAVLFSLRDLTERRRFEVARDEVAMFRSLVQNAATITMLVSSSGRIESASGALTRMLGHDPEQVENEPLAKIVTASDWPALSDALALAREGATATHPIISEVGLLHLDGEQVLPFELTIVNLIDDPTVGGLVVTAHDVSSRTEAEHELRNALSLLKATLDSTADGILVVDPKGNVTNFNGRFAQMWRVPEDRLAGRNDHDAIDFVLNQLVHPEDFTAKIAELELQPRSESIDKVLFKDGRVFERYSKPQLVEGEVVGRVWSFRDITERMRLEAELSHQAFHDALTGLANKALFRDRLDQAVYRMERSGKLVAVLFLDLDNFKTVNDSLGHSTGDMLLGMVAEYLVECMRSSDTVARLGGDEFAVLVEDIENRAEASQVAERILGALRRPVTLGSQEIVATVSIGIALGLPGSTAEQLLRDADLAMYKAKEQGKNRYEEFRDQMHTTVVERLELEAGLRSAVVDKDLVVHYQPIVDLRSASIAGFEALVRWQHPTKGLLSPEAFIPFAEQIGLVESIDHFVLAQACGQLVQWEEMGIVGPDCAVSVNLSTRNMVDGEIAAVVAEVLADTGLRAANLILEITEGTMMKDIESALRQLDSLKALGLRISVDDFGTGYSSLAYLQRLPIDILKIDRTFVAAMTETSQPVGLASAIIRIAETLGQTTIAEGVETAVQVDQLVALGCHLGQGYHLGVPLNGAQTESLLRDISGTPAAVNT